MDAKEVIKEKYQALCGHLDEATLRCWAAVEAQTLGHGGVSTVAKAIGISIGRYHQASRKKMALAVSAPKGVDGRN